jgi:hypothetical protein
MKRLARKKESIVPDEKKPLDEKVIIPPDVLGDRISNEDPVLEHEPESTPTEKEADLTEIPENKADDAREMSFYEKVTGQKPEEHLNDVGDGNSDQEELPQIEKINRKLFLLGGVVFFLTVIVTTIIGAFIISTQKDIDQKTQVVEEAPSATPTPTPIEFERSEFSFEVLNGSGIGGKAKETATIVSGLGYEVLSTGNAQKSDYEGVIVGFASSVSEAQKSLILEDLKKEFSHIEEDDELLPQKNTLVTLIVGK